MPLSIGEIVGDYEIIGILGQGGMGAVYKVRNLISERIDAMKVLLPNLVEEPGLADRFLREIKVLAKLDHPNVTGLRTAFRANDQLWMVMELVEGESLGQILRQRRLTVEEAMHYTLQALEALAYAHEMGVVHRDLKPANMIVTPKSLLKLTDFGIAHDAAESRLTQTGATLGSLAYMSPEQIQRNAVDPRSDIYSLGITFYELLTGSLPFDATTEFALMSAHVNQTPRPPVELNPAIPQHLSGVILRSLAKKPGDRFQTAREFSVAILQSPSASMFAAPTPPPFQISRKKRSIGVWAGASAAALAVFAAAYLYFPRTPPRSASPAPVEVKTADPAPVTPAVVAKDAPAIARPQPEVARPSAPVTDPVKKEWESIAATRDVGVLKAFRERHPDNSYSKTAFQRIQEIQWENARDSHDPARLRAYRDSHPSSPYTPLAVAEADRLEQAAVFRGVLDAVERLRAACEARDLDAVRVVWPTVVPKRVQLLTNLFRNSTSIKVAIDPTGTPQIAGDTAIVPVHHTREVSMKNGQTFSVDEDATITLRKSGSAWFIQTFPVGEGTARKKKKQ